MKKSLYKISESRLNVLKNRGFNYEGKILKKSLSSYLYKDPKREEILNEFEKIVFFSVEKIKLIKAFFNYTADKDYTNL